MHEPVSTSLKPRNRPRAAGVTPANNTPTAPSNESTTLLQQAQAHRYNDTPPQQNVQSRSPVMHQSAGHPGNNPAYLNPFGERPSRDPSPVGRRFIEREFTHTRSRSDPLFLTNNANMPARQAVAAQNVVQQAPQQRNTAHLIPQQNAIHTAQQQQMNTPPITYTQQQEAETMPKFPKWNPFSNDFVLNTQTTDDDFASLREPTVQQGQQSSTRFVEPMVQHGQQGAPIFVEPTVQHGQRETGQAFAAPQFVSGNVQGHYLKQPSNSSLGTQRSSSNSNISPYASDSSRRSSDCDDEAIMARPMVQPENNFLGSSRQNDALLDGPVNAGCDVDEMTPHFNRSTTLHEPYRAQSEHVNDATGVFDSAPFRKPAKAAPVVKTTSAPPVSPGRDPFGAVPFKQREAAKLARRQARKNKEQPGGEARRVLPNIPTQARR